MEQKVEELLIELSMLKDDLHDTQTLIKEKKEELKSICTHEKMAKFLWAREENVNMLDKFIIVSSDKQQPSQHGLILYRCLICMTEMVRHEEDPELEKRVI